MTLGFQPFVEVAKSESKMCLFAEFCISKTGYASM